VTPDRVPEAKWECACGCSRAEHFLHFLWCRNPDCDQLSPFVDRGRCCLYMGMRVR
jgi:hypothetical protein